MKWGRGTTTTSFNIDNISIQSQTLKRGMSNRDDYREGVQSELNGSATHVGTVQIDNLLNFTKKSKLNL